MAVGRNAELCHPGGTHTIVKVGTGIGGGIMKQVPGGPLGWLAYVTRWMTFTPPLKSESLGGKIMKDVTAVPGARLV